MAREPNSWYDSARTSHPISVAGKTIRGPSGPTQHKEVSMTTVIVSPGICGFTSTITATVDEMYNVAITVDSPCPKIQELAGQITQISAFDEIRKPITDSAVYQAAAASKCHTACPIPSAVIKAIEVAAGLALPKDVSFTISND